MISLLMKPMRPRILFFRSRISLYPIIDSKDITTKGLGNYLVRSGISLEAISLVAESTVKSFIVLEVKVKAHIFYSKI